MRKKKFVSMIFAYLCCFSMICGIFAQNGKVFAADVASTATVEFWRRGADSSYCYRFVEFDLYNDKGVLQTTFQGDGGRVEYTCTGNVDAEWTLQPRFLIPTSGMSSETQTFIPSKTKSVTYVVDCTTSSTHQKVAFKFKKANEDLNLGLLRQIEYKIYDNTCNLRGTVSGEDLAAGDVTVNLLGYDLDFIWWLSPNFDFKDSSLSTVQSKFDKRANEIPFVPTDGEAKVSVSFPTSEQIETVTVPFTPVYSSEIPRSMFKRIDFEIYNSQNELKAVIKGEELANSEIKAMDTTNCPKLELTGNDLDNIWTVKYVNHSEPCGISLDYVDFVPSYYLKHATYYGVRLSLARNKGYIESQTIQLTKKDFESAEQSAILDSVKYVIYDSYDKEYATVTGAELNADRKISVKLTGGDLYCYWKMVQVPDTTARDIVPSTYEFIPKNTEVLEVSEKRTWIGYDTYICFVDPETGRHYTPNSVDEAFIKGAGLKWDFYTEDGEYVFSVDGEEIVQGYGLPFQVFDTDVSKWRVNISSDSEKWDALRGIKNSSTITESFRIDVENLITQGESGLPLDDIQLPFCGYKYALGDVNGDDYINISDVVSLQQFLSNNRVFNHTVSYTSDINNDGDVNVFDVVALKRLILQPRSFS